MALMLLVKGERDAEEEGGVGMKPVGSIIPIAGYDICARATCDYGDVLVLNNNSDWYLVVSTDGEAALEGRLEASFHYGERDRGLSAWGAYGRSLAALVNIVGTNSQSLLDGASGEEHGGFKGTRR